MTCAAIPHLKFLECCCATIAPRVQFTVSNFKSTCQSLSLKHIHFSSSLISLKPKNFNLKIVYFVAQTSDWDQEQVESEEITGVSLEERESEGSFVEPPEEAKLFVGNLPYNIDSEKLAKLLEPAGVVEMSEVIFNRQTNQSRGFGFVTMSSTEEAEKAVEMFNQYDLNGRLLTIKRAAPRGSQPERVSRTYEPSFRMYVGNLSWKVDNSELEQLFSKQGKVIDARVVLDRETGRSRGFGFVTMSSETEINDAIAALDGQELDGRAIRVNVAEERPRRSTF